MDCCFGRKISSLSCENFLDFLNPISNVYFFIPNVYFFGLNIYFLMPANNLR